jgi:SAM-dependent methyltransferase
VTSGCVSVYPFVVDLVSRRTPPAGTVLEVGCGAMQYEPFLPGRYIGLDLPSSPYLRRQPEILGSAEHIPLEAASVDVVFGVGAFYLMERIVDVFRECLRVIRPGGALMVFDYRRHVIEGFVERGDDAVRSIWGPRELRCRLHEAGFAYRRIRDLSHLAAESDPPPLRRHVRFVKRFVFPRWTPWLIFEAKKAQRTLSVSQ